jgi:hypothetical protein
VTPSAVALLSDSPVEVDGAAVGAHAVNMPAATSIVPFKKLRREVK